MSEDEAAARAAFEAGWSAHRKNADGLHLALEAAFAAYWHLEPHLRRVRAIIDLGIRDAHGWQFRED